MKKIYRIEDSDDLYRLFSKTRQQGDGFPTLPDGCSIKLHIENLRFRLEGNGSDSFDFGELSQRDFMDFMEFVFSDKEIKLNIELVNT